MVRAAHTRAMKLVISCQSQHLFLQMEPLPSTQGDQESLQPWKYHNAHEIEDGKWSWRYDIGRAWKNEDNENASKTIDFSELWNKVAGIKSPVHLWLGGAWSVVGDEDVEKMKSFQQEMVVKKVKGAGHSIQGDKPLELKELIRDLLRSKIVN